MSSPCRLLVLCAFLLVSQVNLAQNFFQKTYDINSDRANSLAVFPDGKIALAGSTGQAPDFQTLYPLLQLCNEKGELLWSKTYPVTVTGSFDDVVVADDGNLLLVWTGSDRSGWMKIAPDGALVWAKWVPAAANSAGFYRIRPLNDGKYLLLGTRKSGNNLVPFLIKIDENGNRLWSSQLELSGISSINDASEDANGFLYCVGAISPGFGQADGWLAKLGPNGALSGSVQYFSSAGGQDALMQITNTTQDRQLLAGYSNGFGNGAFQLWLTEIDGAGAVRWSKTYELPGNDLFPRDMLHLPGDQFLLTLGDNEDLDNPAILFKIDLSGDIVLLANQYRTNGEGDVLRRLRTSPSGFSACGWASRNGNVDTWLIQTEPNGNIPGCCPAAVTLTIKNVTPSITNSVPVQENNHSVSQLPAFQPQDENAVTFIPCFEINTDFTLSADTICPGDCIQITLPDPTPGATYAMDVTGGEPDPVHSGKICYPEAGEYTIARSGQIGFCTQATTRKVLVSSIDSKKVPTAFSPDNDGTNDKFKLIFQCKPETYLMRVYSRWGEIVYESIDPNEGWDGTIYGTPCAADVYIWTATVDGIMSHGEVTLLK
ncbi:MAG TPA: gliding motility-associated C-terminal domain-containing protein [Saprospiraceae bacterium]|nr:gliding motility-associated C-terminal domain-containing protein [Saprospiraceae bacterium]